MANLVRCNGKLLPLYEKGVWNFPAGVSINQMYGCTNSVDGIALSAAVGAGIVINCSAGKNYLFVVRTSSEIIMQIGAATQSASLPTIISTGAGRLVGYYGGNFNAFSFSKDLSGNALFCATQGSATTIKGIYAIEI